MGEQQPAVADEHAQQRELDWREMHLLTLHPHCMGGQVDDEPVRLDLWIGVAHENALAERHRAAPSSAGLGACSRSGNSTTKLVPWPGTDSTPMRPPFSSTKPLAIASPSPEPWWPSRVSVER